MIAYHAMWNLVYRFGVEIPWFSGLGGSVFQAYIRWSFILISGFSFSLGKNHLKRGLEVLFAACIIELFTYFAMPQSAIKYGILTFIATAMLLMIPLDKLFERLWPIAGLCLSALLFAFTYRAREGYFGFGELLEIKLPAALYVNELTAYLGFPSPTFYSADYVPVLPWIFLFFAGYFLYKTFERYCLLKYLSPFSVKPLELVGRNALPIYVLHQPVIYGILYLLFLI